MVWKMPNAGVVAAILLLVTVQTVLAATTTTTTTNEPQQDFDSGGNDETKSLNIELIKLSILNKLGMQRPPEFGGQRPLQVDAHKCNNDCASSTMVQPWPIRVDATRNGGTDMHGRKTATAITRNTFNCSSNDEVDDDDYHVKTQKLIAFAQPHPTKLNPEGQYPLYFTFSEQTQHYRVTKAILWVYKRRLDVVIDNSAVIIDVFRINPINLQQSFVSSIVKLAFNTTEPGWIPIELKENMSDWFNTMNKVKDLTLMVQAHYLNKNATYDEMPYITDARNREDIAEIPYLEVHTHFGDRNRREAGLEQRTTRRDWTAAHVHDIRRLRRPRREHRRIKKSTILIHV